MVRFSRGCRRWRPKFAGLVLTGLITALAAAEEDPAEAFEEGMQRLRREHREAVARQLLTADRVVVHLVSFELVEDEPGEEEGKHLEISPYGRRTKVLASKEIAGDERSDLLEKLGRQIAVPEHSGGAFCHIPVHGIEVYRGDRILYATTFCWGCGNFFHSYPDSNQWLDTNGELKELFMKLMPIPKEELERLYRKYPGMRPQEEKKDGEEGKEEK